MQSKMFVFVGLTDRSQTVDLTLLLSSLNHLTNISDDTFSLKEGAKLVTAIIGDVSYYVSFASSKKEIRDWLQLKEDFELSGSMDPLNKESLSQKFIDTKKNHPDLYSDEEYFIATKIFDTISSISTCPILSFH